MSDVEGVPRSRTHAWQLLDSAFAWEALRLALDGAFGLYRRRMATLSRWGVLEAGPSVLDVGCGIGQYASVTSGRYLGVDMTERYIKHAQQRRGGRSDREFLAADVTSLESEQRTFDIVLMVDFLHHLDDSSCDRLLKTSARLAGRYVISFEPVTEQYSRLGRWIIDHDRGDHMRSLDVYHQLLERAPLSIRRSEELRLGPINTRAVLLSVPPAAG